MKAKGHNSKYRLLVLMDLSKASETALRNAVQLAKAIEGKVEVFHVKAPADVVNYENQFSAIRAIQEDTRNAQKMLKKIIRKTEKEGRIRINFKIAYGNIKNAIKEKISKAQPDIVLLGKKKSRLVNFLSNGITNFVLKEFSTNILIAGEDHKFHSYTDISLGVYGEAIQQGGLEIINDLNQSNTSPVRFFSIRNKKNIRQKTVIQKNDREMVSYVFSEGINAFDGLATYISKTNMQLFCISRKHGLKTTMKQMIQKLDIPVLILG